VFFHQKRIKMRVIDEKECAEVPIGGRGGRTPLFRQIAALEVGQGVLIEPEEWTKSYPPTRISARIAKLTGKRFKGGRNLKTRGWMIQRIA
jgi:hypothetical protein